MSDSRMKKKIDKKVLATIQSNPDGITLLDLRGALPQFSESQLKNSIMRISESLYEEDDGRLVYSDHKVLIRADLAALYGAYKENPFERPHEVIIDELL